MKTAEFRHSRGACGQFLLAAALILAFPFQGFGAVVITELMYHPANDNESREFVEIYNSGPTSVSLTGWCIVGIDFCFPTGASISASSFQVVARDAVQFQSAYGIAPDYVFPGQLSNSGERVAITNGSGVTQDEVTYGSVGLWPVKPDGLGPSLERIDPTIGANTPRNWRASTAAAGHTARALNSVNASGLPPWITNVTHPNNPAALAPLTVTAQVVDATSVTLIYKIDFGTEASGAMFDDGAHGDGGAGDGVFGALIPGQAVNKLVRYRIVATGPTGSMNYPRLDDTVIYSGLMVRDSSLITALPVFQWFMDPTVYQAAINHKLTDQLEPAVFAYEGVVYDNVMVRVRGQSSRSWPKNHWKFFMPQGHDFDAPGLIASPVDQFCLQCNYSDKAYVREILSYETFRDAGHASNQIFHVRLQQNGQFYGLYNFLENMDDDYLARNHLDSNAAWYKASDDCRFRPLSELPSRYQKEQRVSEDDTDLFDFLSGINNLSGQARHNFLMDNVNIPDVINYLAAQCIVHNNDQVAKNYFLYRDTEGTGRWTCQTWDMDLTFGRNYGAGGGVLSDGIWADADAPQPGNLFVSPSHPLFGDINHRKWDDLWNRFTNVIYDDPQIRNMYYRRLRTLMDKLLPTGLFENRIDYLASRIGPEAVLDAAKWGQYGTPQTLATAVQILKDSYLTVRRTHLFITHRVAGEIPPAQTNHPQIVINEIMYNPASSGDAEYIELFNPSAVESVDLSGWRLDGIALQFPSGSVILPNDYFLVNKDDSVFRATYGSGKFVGAQYTGSLDNGGETLVVRHRDGTIIDSVTYDNVAPWPVSADGGGYSLELVDASRDNDRVNNWAASVAVGGTPGAANSRIGSSSDLPSLFVNEILPLNISRNRDETGQFDPWIEIYNSLNNPINIGGMYLTDNYVVPAKWPIPLGTQICGGEHILFWADNSPNSGPMHANFTLSATSGSVGMYTADGHIVDFLNYSGVPANISYGRLPDGKAQLAEFSIVTPSAANNGDATPIILNEYNAVRPTSFIKDGGTDTYWGRILGNGGDWFELVVTRDHLDMRGWQLVVNNNAGVGVPQILTLTSNPIWANLRSGTIITISEDLPDDVSYNPAGGDWWINVRASAAGTGTYITAANFEVTQDNWQLSVRDNLGSIVFGPAGEGVEPASGIGNDEIFKLEQDPGAFIHPHSDYNDGSSSTFGAPNIYSGGTLVQDFTSLRSSLVLCSGSSDCDDGNPCTMDACLDGECVNTPLAPCDRLSLGSQDQGGPEIRACANGQLAMVLSVAGLHAPVNGVQAVMNYDTSRLHLSGIVPGDGATSPWNSAGEVIESDIGGMIEYAVVLLGNSSQVDATVATLFFDVLSGGENEDPTQIAFSSNCTSMHSKLTTFDNQTIVPATSNSPPVYLGTRIDVAMQIQGLSNAVNRSVTFALSNCVNPTQYITRSIAFDSSGFGALTIFDVDPGIQWVSAVEGHSLKATIPLVFSGCTATASFVGSNQLIAGDLQTNNVPQDNFVDILDYAILAARWNTIVADCSPGIPAECGKGADINGDGSQSTADFTALLVNFLAVGDLENQCPPGVRNPPQPNGERRLARRMDRNRRIRSLDVSAEKEWVGTSLSLTEAVGMNPVLAVADVTGDGLIDVDDIRQFAVQHGLTVSLEFERRVSENTSDSPARGLEDSQSRSELKGQNAVEANSVKQGR